MKAAAAAAALLLALLTACGGTDDDDSTQQAPDCTATPSVPACQPDTPRPQPIKAAL